MPRKRWLVLCVPLAALAAQVPAAATDWPGWRGADRPGVSPETGLLKEWPKDGPKLVWKATDLGGGYSTPSVARGPGYPLGSKNGEELATPPDAHRGRRREAVRPDHQQRDGQRGGQGRPIPVEVRQAGRQHQLLDADLPRRLHFRVGRRRRLEAR